MKLDKAKGWVAFIIALTTLVGTAFTLDNRYAKQTQTTAKIDSVEQTIQQVEQRLDKKILKDRADVLQERIGNMKTDTKINQCLIQLKKSSEI